MTHPLFAYHQSETTGLQALIVDINENLWEVQVESSDDGKTRTRLYKFNDAPMGIVSISMGLEHVVMIDKFRQCWAMGNNRFAQLGLGRHDSSKVTSVEPIRAFKYTSINQVACGLDFTMFLDYEGKVWCCGNNNDRFLGLGPHCEPIVYEPRTIPDIPPITSISCYSQHSLLLDQGGCVWATGCNCSNERSEQDYDEECRNTPNKISNLPPNIVQISTGDHLSMALDSLGDVYLWGNVPTFGFFFHTNRIVSHPTNFTSVRMQSSWSPGHDCDDVRVKVNSIYNPGGKVPNLFMRDAETNRWYESVLVIDERGDIPRSLFALRPLEPLSCEDPEWTRQFSAFLEFQLTNYLVVDESGTLWNKQTQHHRAKRMRSDRSTSQLLFHLKNPSLCTTVSVKSARNIADVTKSSGQ